jgi:hypothetical protein
MPVIDFGEIACQVDQGQGIREEVAVVHRK